MSPAYSSRWEQPQNQGTGQVPPGAQGHCPPAVGDTRGWHSPSARGLGSAAGRFLSFPPQKNPPAVPGDSSLSPSAPALPLSPRFMAGPFLSPRPSCGQTGGGRWDQPLPPRTRRLLPKPAPNGDRRGPGAPGSPQRRFWLIHCFRDFFPPNFPPPCGVQRSQRSRNVVIAWVRPRIKPQAAELSPSTAGRTRWGLHLFPLHSSLPVCP